MGKIADQIRRWFSAFGLIRRPLGERGERYAARLLRRKGHRVLFAGERNRFGELDLITIDERSTNRTVVFVEVKTRSSLQAGSPAEAVTLEKQGRLTRAALSFLKTHDLMEHPARFDVVAIHWPKEARHPTSVEHIENAFEEYGS